jgi:hypothetical protein
MAQFRVTKGETLFMDGEDSVSIHILQKQAGAEWINVFELTLESGRSWGDQIDFIYQKKDSQEDLLIHVSGFGYWGDTEYYRSLDGGDSWQPTRLRREPEPGTYCREELPQLMD